MFDALLKAPKKLYKTIIQTKGILKIENKEIDLNKKEAFFTRSELDQMRTRAKRFDSQVNQDHVGTPITFEEFEKLERRTEWDKLLIKQKDGSKVDLLATDRETMRGLKRAGIIPGSRRKSLDTPLNQRELKI